MADNDSRLTTLYSMHIIEANGLLVTIYFTCHVAVVQWLTRSLIMWPARFDSRTRRRALSGVKTWLSTLEIVYLCVFRIRL